MRYGRYTQLVLCQSLCSACLQKRMSELIRNALGPVRAIPNPTKAPFAREEPLASNTVRQCSKWNSLLCRKPKWPSSLNRCYGSFWAGSRLSGLGSCKAEAAIQDWWQQICENIMIRIFSKYRLTSYAPKVFRSLSKGVWHERYLHSGLGR